MDFLVFDARYPTDPDRALVLEVMHEKDFDDCGKRLADSYGECVIALADRTDCYTVIDVNGEVADWSDAMDKLICDNAEKGLDILGRPLAEVGT